MVVDLSYFLHFSSLASERRNFLTPVLEQYFTTMNTIVKSENLPFNKGQFLKEMQDNKTGFFYGLLLLGIGVYVYKMRVDGAQKANNKEDLEKFTEKLKEFEAIVKEIAEEANQKKIFEEYRDFEIMLWKTE